MFSGLGVAVITPFTTEGELDEAALIKILHYLIDNKTDYLVALGTTGEPATQTDGEQNEILDIFFQEAGEKIPIVIGCGGNNTKSISQRIRFYTETYRPAGILSVSPYYNKPTQQGIYQHYHYLASETDIPIILYNVPGRTASNIDAETTVMLAQNHHNIVAIKEASGNYLHIMELFSHIPSNFQVISGDDFTAFNTLALGGSGIISVIGNAFPQQMSNLIQFVHDGRIKEARKIHYQLLPLMHMCFSEGNPAGVKAIMHELQLCGRQVRLPLVSASDQLITNIRKEMAFTT